MALLLASYGTREILLYGLLWTILAAGAWILFPPLVALPILGLLFTLYFFRDPVRRPPRSPDLLVAPADGTVVEISTTHEGEFIKEEALKIGIFLSVFNVHVNRAPCSGVVRAIRYTPGRFRDARTPDCGKVNEQNAIHIDGPVPVVVTQIAGAIARRIVCAIHENEQLEAGQRIGMIKFGSRTDLYIPKTRLGDLNIKLGDRVKGGETVLARIARS
ncbi:MAG: phosphatidylserine decarboxylase family protein [Planctomycetes bacterium]|nr:phosphatidylserine decarboxylase family protein [Planctomycetota bacterium]